mgnify:CR=1 FL=1
MDTTTMIFTMWIGSFNYYGTFIGRVMTFPPACAGNAVLIPTIDAEYEVVADDAADQ